MADSNLTPEGLVQEVKDTVVEHFEEAKLRVPVFIENNHRNFSAVLWRNVKSLRDVPTHLGNLGRWIWRRMGGDATSIPTSTENEIRNLFLAQVIDTKGLEAKVEAVQEKYAAGIDAKLLELRSHRAVLQMTPEELERHLLQEVDRLDDASEVVKSLVKGAAFAIACYVVTGTVGNKLTSLMPAGAAVAQSIFMANTSFFGTIYYSVFGVPQWVGIVGGAAGAAAGLLLAPLLGAFVEYLLNQRSSVETQFRKVVDDTCVAVLYGKPETDTREGLVETMRKYFKQGFQLVSFLDRAICALEENG